MLSVPDRGGKVGQVQNCALRAPLEGAIEARPPLLLDLRGQALPDLPFRPRPEPSRGELRGAMAHAVRDVLSGDDEILAGLVLASQQDVDVRIVGVPVVSRRPLEPRPKIALDLRHELTGVGLQIGNLCAVLRRDDDLAVMPVGLDPPGKGLGVDLILPCRLEATRAAVRLYSVPLDVVEILPDRRESDLRMLDDADLHDHPPRARSESSSGQARGRVTSPEPRSRASASREVAQRLP